MKRSFARIFAVVGLVCLSLSVQAEDADPFESFNRGVFRFNDTLDRWLLKPVSQGYVRVIPTPFQNGVSNFFGNLEQPRNALNHLLQAEWERAGQSSGRFVANTTVGIFGLFDVASDWGLADPRSDFGLTLGSWGVPGESYLMVPLLGPNTLRSTAGIPVDHYAWPPTHLLEGRDYWSAVVLRSIDQRAGLLDQEDLIVGDRYTFIRDAYLQNRHYQLTGELPEDDF